MRRIRNVSVSAALLLFILTLSMIAVKINHVAGQAATILVDPSEMVAEPNETFTISVFIIDVPVSPGVSAWQFSLRYDPAVLFNNGKAYPETDYMINEGEFLKQGGSGLSELAVTKEANSITVTQFIQSPVNHTVSGEGALASISFKVIGKGNTTLHLYDTLLWDFWPDPDKYTGHTTVDGLFYSWSPKADFTYTYRNQTIRGPIIDETITFNATYDATARTGSYDPNPGGGIMNYTWDFGDLSLPTVTTTPVVNHSYTNVGDYIIMLTVIDNGNNFWQTNQPRNDVTQKQLHISSYDIALTNIAVYPAVAMPGTMVSINATVTNFGTTSAWFNVTVYYDNTPIWFNQTEGKSAYCLPLEWDPEAPGQHMPALLPGKSLLIKYKWNTTGVPETPVDEPYTIQANVSLIASAQQYRFFLADVESNLDNNRKEGPEMFITSSPKNIAVKSITISPSSIAVGEGPITIFITIENQGIFLETFNITVYYNLTTTRNTVLFYNQSNIDIQDKSSKLLELSWNTTTLARGTYIILANVSYVPNEMVLSDNAGSSYPVEAVITDPPIASFNYSPTMPKVYETVTFDASESYDPDGKIDFYTWNFDDGSSTIESEPTASHIFSSAKTYTVTLTVTDNATITRAYTKSIAIDKRNSKVDISTPSTTVTFGTGIKISGTVSPATFRANVTIQTKLPEETTWTNITTTMTNATGGYSHSWTPPSAKTFQLKALWPGDANTYGNESTTISVIVNKMSSTLSIDLSAETLKAGSAVTVSGKITPERAEVTVTIYYRLAGASSWQSLSDTSDATGFYSVSFSLAEAGTYEIKARWEGDTNTKEADSITKNLSVEALSALPQGILSYLIVGIGLAIAAVAIAVYFFKIRKH